MILLLSNREAVPVAFWPFALVLALPLGWIMLGTLALGFVLGLVFHLPARFSAHRRARRAEKRVSELEAKTP